jgi:hypothetical protein
MGYTTTQCAAAAMMTQARAQVLKAGFEGYVAWTVPRTGCRSVSGIGSTRPQWFR